MTRERLQAALYEIGTAPQRTLQNVTSETIWKLAPHLDANEVAGLLMDVRHPRCNREVVFIGPPLLIRGAEHVYLLRTWHGGVQLQWTGVHRRKESFYNTEVPRGWQAAEYQYRERVANYAELNYGHALQWDETRQVVVWHVLRPEHSFGITAGYRRDWTEMQQLAEGRCPFLQVLDHQLCAATAHPAVSMEIQGGRMPMMSRTCGMCGGGVVGKTCTHCFHDYFSADPPWDIPIHVNLLESVGQYNTFDTNPIHAIKVHYARWAADGVRPFIKPVQHDRVITFPDEDNEV